MVLLSFRSIHLSEPASRRVTDSLFDRSIALLAPGQPTSTKFLVVQLFQPVSIPVHGVRNNCSLLVVSRFIPEAHRSLVQFKFAYARCVQRAAQIESSTRSTVLVLKQSLHFKFPKRRGRLNTYGTNFSKCVRLPKQTSTNHQ